MSRAQFRGSQAVVTIGPAMAERLRPKAGPGVTWIPLWGADHREEDVAARETELRQERNWGPQETVFMYSGNMGRGHLLGEFLETAARLHDDGGAARFVFSGSGPKRDEVKNFANARPDVPLELLPYVALEDLPAHLATADVLLASLEPEWSGCMLPSKIQGIFAAARPVIFVGDPESTPARWIRDAGAGWVVTPGDVDGLVRAAREACVPGERARRGANALTYAQSHFDREENCRRIRLLLETTAAPGAG
jgi:glycosyltransferase involved in cell wall biosynthesis